jgi:ribose 5-phosphate isomerase B
VPTPPRPAADPHPAPLPDRASLRRLVAEVVGGALEAPGGGPACPVHAPAAGSAGTGSRSAAAPPRSDAPPPPPPPEGGRAGRAVVAIGSDHGAWTLKNQLARYLREELGHPVIDLGAYSEEAVDYPDIARAVARAVVDGHAWRGIVLDAMGIGSTMAANKVPGALCALCHDPATARNAREHNDANLLALGSRVVSSGAARALVRLFLQTEHAGGRHARRVAKIKAIEQQYAAGPPSERGPSS